jgi:hypothetical protein
MNPTFSLGIEMKKLSIYLAAVLGCASLGLTGCSGETENTVIEQTQPQQTLSAEQEEQYRQQMESGGGYSSQPGN